MNRREFLKLSLTLAIGGLAMTTEAAENFSAKTIDFHAHAILPSYVDALKILKIDAQAEEGFTEMDCGKSLAIHGGRGHRFYNLINGYAAYIELRGGTSH